MVRALGIVFIGILITSVVLVSAFLTGSDFLYEFARNQSVGVTATVLAINVAVVTFIVGTLISIETRLKKNLFNKTRIELRHNLVFMAVLFLLNFVVVVANKPGILFHFNQVAIDITYILTAFTALVIVLNVIAMYEIVGTVFQLKDFFEANTKTDSK